MSNPVELVLSRLDDPKPAGDGKWTARCPAHEDRRPSLSLAKGGDGCALVKCHAGCSTEAILTAIGLKVKDLFAVNDDTTSNRQRKKGSVSARNGNGKPSQVFTTCAAAVAELERRHGKRAAAWTYHDAQREPVGMVVRWDRPGGAKDIRPVSRHGDGWRIEAMPAPRPLYCLPELLASAGRVFVVEGEKAADAARALGLIATASAGGSGAGKKGDWQPLAGRDVVILPDNDTPGRKYAETVAAILAALSPLATVRIVELPGLPEKGDIVEYIKAARENGLDDATIRTRIGTLANTQAVANPGASTAEAIDQHVVDDSAEIDLDERESFPTSLSDAAYQGMAGDIVRAIEPHTEASPVAILLQILVAFGNIIGRGPYFMVEGTRHHCNLFAVVVGQSSKSRKGTSWDRIRQLCQEAELQKGFLQPWVGVCIASGASSGEGIIHAIRDQFGEDEGIDDKRLLVQESEFAKVLKNIERQGNTLSAVLRDAWDGHTLRTLTRSNAIKATQPHVSVVGHITADELCRLLDATESVNGFANRYLFALAKRSKYLPEGGGQYDLASIGKRFGDALSYAQEVHEMRRDDDARARWREIYPELSDGFSGLAGAICGRAEAQVLRLSMVYALMDQSCLIRVEHLEAALALWRYCEDSARCIFGGATGDEVADRIAGFLRAAGPNGMTQTEIIKALGGHHKKARLERAFKALLEAKKVRYHETPSGGRKRRTWYWNGHGAAKEAN